MTGVRELSEIRIASAAPEQARLSVLADGTQMDISLPLDAPVAVLVPELVRLVRSREDSPSEPTEDPSAKEARRNVWVLSRADGGMRLEPDETLRTAGVVNGDLLRLTAQRALTAPTLSDDVVDAAARLNKAAFAGWDATAARWMAFVGLYLGAAAWVYFLVDNAFRAQRGAFVGLSSVVAAALVGVAALLHRSYGDRGSGAALGWAAVPITGAVAWALLSPLGDYGVAAGCAGMLLVLYAFYRVIGTGHWAYVVAAVYFGFGGLAMAAHALAVSVAVTGTAVAVVGTLACLMVPRLTAHLGRFDMPTVDVESRSEGRVFDSPSTASVSDPQHGAGAALPTADDVWARVRSATLTRSALYCGLALAAATAAAVAMHGHPRAS
ncbi:MAG TPA: type VII secretion integral membrane protein EccD, partial [Mycobacterium sp.]|nr:type VII secretion integral membrane protein EccD [Mycobacterium sp.]